MEDSWSGYTIVTRLVLDSGVVPWYWVVERGGGTSELPQPLTGQVYFCVWFRLQSGFILCC